MTAPTLLILTAQPARVHVIMAIAARLPLVHAPDLAMAYAAKLTDNLNLWEQTPAWRLFPCTYFILLDFCAPFLRFNVQSATLSHPFWTSAYINSASTSNPPLLLIPFGLPRAISPLKRPICRVSTSPTKGSRILRSAPVGAKPRSTGPCAPLSKNPATPCFIH